MMHEYFMREALKEAKKAYSKNETPIGAVAVYEDKIIARAHNLRETKQDSTMHAELQVLQKACKKLGTWRLEQVSVYVTLEPCVMCAGAMIQARVKNVFYGAKNNRFGAHQGAIHLFDVPFNHQINVIGGILEEECATMISSFFKDLRLKS
ncbi:MAG: tRNA adenosine(34) deaminase TadA [Roseburia sp.]|nr:tRNA adenosine(34) deaminase TadA [Anaeroplasma bactoclasticum]MCM1196380.1 tRNA adenosine(34) deaminase TadA [Roseburia sp.]MCM1556147.1 tRNA adenosine(34) deaminase TadA [Anaeroplasma bactoclasticum]